MILKIKLGKHSIYLKCKCCWSKNVKGKQKLRMINIPLGTSYLKLQCTGIILKTGHFRTNSLD